LVRIQEGIRVADPTYEERYCAFVDIQGFKTLVDAVESGKLPFGDLRELLRFVQSAGETRPYAPQIGYHSADLRYQSISDAICLSSAVRPAGLLHLFFAIQHLSMMLLYKGYFARGAVVKGRIYHDDKMVFGDAFIQAYNLEQTIVRYPRIMLTRQVALDVDVLHDAMGDEFANSVGKATDGPHYFHVLRALTILDDERYDQNVRDQLITRFNGTAAPIQMRFDESADNPSHFEKVRWFANYWNESIASYPQLRRIFGAGLDAPPLSDHRLVLG
jgi:hypothetical protein